MKLYTFDNGDGVKRVGVELSGFPGLIRDVRDFGLPYRDMTDLIRHITPLEKERMKWDIPVIAAKALSIL